MSQPKPTLKLFYTASDVAEYRKTLAVYNLEPVKPDFTTHYRAFFNGTSPYLEPLSADMILIDEYTNLRKLVHRHPHVADLTLFKCPIRQENLSHLLTFAWAESLKAITIVPADVPSNVHYQIAWENIWPRLAIMWQLESLLLFGVRGSVDLVGVSGLKMFGLAEYEEGDLFETLEKCGSNLNRLLLSHSTRTTNPFKESSGSTQEFQQIPDDFRRNYSGFTDLAVLSSIDYTATVLLRLLQVKPQLKTTLTSLNLDCDSFGEPHCSLGLVRLVCDQFQKLHHLSVCLKSDIKLVDLLPYLSQLPHLVELGLTNNTDHFLENQSIHVALPTVQYLHLSTTINLTDLPMLSILFPSLLQFEFDLCHLKCVSSDEGTIHPLLEHLPSCSVCRRQLMATLNEFANLPKLETVSRTASMPSHSQYSALFRSKWSRRSG